MKATKVIVIVRGGVVQDVFTDTESTFVMVVDHDNESASGRADRKFLKVEVNRQMTANTSAANEAQD